MASSADNTSKKSRYRAIAVAAAPVVIFGGVYIAWTYASRFFKGKNEPKPKDGRILSRSMSFAALHGGKLALERLIDYHRYRANSTAEVEAAVVELKRTLATKQNPNFKELQGTLVKLEMNRKEDEAVQVLEDALAKARKKGQTHEAYEIEMLLVEMYIYKGDFEKALRCKCLDDKDISDARGPLYKGIIHLMLKRPGDEELAAKYWEEFKDIRTHLVSPPIFKEQDELYKVISDFQEFKKVVGVLEKDIQEARQLKRQ